MRAWLCMNPVCITTMGMRAQLPPECLVLLGVFRTKKAAREVAGPKAVLVRVEWPVEKGGFK